VIFTSRLLISKEDYMTSM